MTTLEEQRKVLLPILKRADEVQQQEPKVAYYCRLYAVHQALSFEKRQPDIDSIVKILMSRLEKDKQKVQLSDTDQQHCETFAQLIFNRAEKMDQAGKWDQNTVIAYYSASYFIEICKQFGELAPDLAQMQKFAAWKASDLRKAIREGREPTPRALPSRDSITGEPDAAMPGVPDGGLPQELPRSFQSLDSMPRGSQDSMYPTSRSSGMPAEPEASPPGALHPPPPTPPINMPGSKAPQHPLSSSERGFSGGFDPREPLSNGSGYPAAFPPGPYAPPPPPAMPPGHHFDPAAHSQPADGSGVHHGMHRFYQGDSVYHKASSSSPPQPAKIVGFFTRPDGQQLFTVAVAGGSSPVPATADQLAQNFEPGERVLFRPADKRPSSEASVNQTDLTQWRPVYHITCDHGESCTTGDDCLTRLEEEPRDPLMPPSSLPSKISTSPSEDAQALNDPYSPAPGTPRSSARTPPAFHFPATSGPGPESTQPSAPPQGPADAQFGAPDANFGGYPSLRSPAQQPAPPPPPPQPPVSPPPWQHPQQPQPPFMGSAPSSPPPVSPQQVQSRSQPSLPLMPTSAGTPNQCFEL
ncbi:hypothetical protein WJX84_003534 [Apatococcus fuscideae]|uniref:Vta1/callose synthase N-terminal domain-containing protein n=1 Tax=Apatococcus fuscideae TaxID=2026836 RepID=A0AAW1SPU2_9CHLO